MLPPCHAQQQAAFPITLHESLRNAARANHSRIGQVLNKTPEQRRQELIQILEMALELSASCDNNFLSRYLTLWNFAQLLLDKPFLRNCMNKK